MVAKAHEEMRDLMTEHITNTDRMNTFLSALSDNRYNLNKNQRKEIIKLYGIASEIFEDSLVTFVHKIIMHLQKLLKENLDFIHYSIASSLGKIVFNITSRIQNSEELLDQTNLILRILF